MKGKLQKNTQQKYKLNIAKEFIWLRFQFYAHTKQTYFGMLTSCEKI